jgi:hypothetical protein
LFNLRDDPFEQDDLVQSKPVELKRLMGGLVAALEADGATYPVDKPGGKALQPVMP